jgi:hypothetical protein
MTRPIAFALVLVGAALMYASSASATECADRCEANFHYCRAHAPNDGGVYVASHCASDYRNCVVVCRQHHQD